jgi:phospholipid/cholesterol/gamma-HCH transport system substrate-binding protein
MENRSFALATGLFLAGLLLAAIAAGFWLGGSSLERSPYRVIATQPVTGLNLQGQVRYRGISVGRVTGLDLDRKDPRRIIIEIEVNTDVPLTKGTYAQLGQEGITGIAYVHLLDDRADTTPLAAADGGIPEIAMRASPLDDIFETVSGLGRDARALVASMNGVINKDNQAQLAATLGSLARASANIETVSRQLPAAIARVDRNLDGWLSPENQKLARGSLQGINDTATELPALAKGMRQVIDDAQSLVVQVNKLSTEAQVTAGSMRQDTLPRVNALAESMERSADRIGRLATELERRPASMVWGRGAGRPGPGESGFQ